MRTSIKFRGKEVQNPIIGGILILLLIIVGYFGIMMGPFMIFLGLTMTYLILGLFVAFLLITIPLHLSLRALGRRGFIEMKNDGISIEISGKGFQKK